MLGVALPAPGLWPLCYLLFVKVAELFAQSRSKYLSDSAEARPQCPPRACDLPLSTNSDSCHVPRAVGARSP